MYVKLGRLFEIEAILKSTQTAWTGVRASHRITLAALGMPSPTQSQLPESDRRTQIPPLLKVWHLLSGDAHAGGQRLDLYWNLDYVCAMTQSFLRARTLSTPAEELRDVPGFAEAKSGLNAALARYIRCENLLK